MAKGAPRLVKEVQTPQRYDNGLSVLVVSSAAVFMALLGSSMVLRARANCAVAHKPVVAPPVAPAATAPPAPMPTQPAACGEPVFHDGADGTLRIEYTVCPAPAAEDGRAAPATRLPDDLRLR